MANIHTNEKELYEQIKNENITVHPLVWDALYLYLGDYISGINFIASYYVEKNEPIPLEDAQKIFVYSKKVKEIVDKLLHHEQIQDENDRLQRIKSENISMHPVVREMVNHYIGNDTLSIHLIVCDYLDPKDPKPILVEHAQRILNRSLAMSEFLDKFRKATHKDVSF